MSLSDKITFYRKPMLRGAVICVEDVKEFIKKERGVIDFWLANLERNEQGEKIISVEDLLNLSERLNREAGAKLI